MRMRLLAIYHRELIGITRARYWILQAGEVQDHV